MGYLYRLDFASGKRYIGITNEPTAKRRFLTHRGSAKAGSGLAVHRAWRKYGEPRMKVLAIATGEFLLELERRAVAAFRTSDRDGYNLTPGGDFNPATTPEARAKMSLARRGRPLSPETRAKMSARVFTAEHRANIAKAKTGSKHSPETIAKLTGRTRSPEHCARISASKRRVSL